jgi:hypothetical protein
MIPLTERNTTLTSIDELIWFIKGVLSVNPESNLSRKHLTALTQVRQKLQSEIDDTRVDAEIREEVHSNLAEELLRDATKQVRESDRPDRYADPYEVQRRQEQDWLSKLARPESDRSQPSFTTFLPNPNTLFGVDLSK